MRTSGHRLAEGDSLGLVLDLLVSSGIHVRLCEDVVDLQCDFTPGGSR